MKIKPLADRVVVKPLEQDEAKVGSLYIPDTAKEKPQEGQVVAAGPGKVSDSGVVVKMEVKVGDKVLYGKYAGNEVKIDGDDYLIMRQSDILARI